MRLPPKVKVVEVGALALVQRTRVGPRHGGHHDVLRFGPIGALAERRIALLTDAALSSLPPFLTEEPGLNSGFMIAHVTAAALASENKSLAHPASVDSLLTSANQEDHVSMATFAARRLADILENLEGILAIELLAGAQGVDLRRPLKTGPRLQAVVDRLRETVPFLADDRAFAPDIAAARGLIAEGSLGKIARLDGEFDAHFSI